MKIIILYILLVSLLFEVLSVQFRYKVSHRLHEMSKFKFRNREGTKTKTKTKRDKKCEERQVVMGPCKNWQERFWYDPFLEDCRFFIWGGDSCEEYKYVERDQEMNRWETMKDCKAGCKL